MAEAAGLAASIIAILELTVTVVKYMNDVKDAPKDRARFEMEAMNFYSLLLNLRFHLEDGRSNEAWYKKATSLGLSGGPLYQYKHALEELQPKILGGKGVTKIRNALLWKFVKEEVASILSRIERLKSLIQIALQMDHFKLSQAIKNCMDEIHNDNEALKIDMSVVRTQMPALQDSVDGVQRGQDKQKHQMLVEWISSAKFSSQQSDFIAKRQDGTGQWFLDSPEFSKWLCGPKETLFCPGIPGAGKTMMSAIVIDHLHRKSQSDDIGVVQIFCNYKSQSAQNTTSLLSAILKQLVQARPLVAEAASGLYEQYSSGEGKPSYDDIFNALKTTLKNFSTVYVVVDALDECSDQDSTRLLAKLRDLQREVDLRLMVTSRFIRNIENEFKLSLRLHIRASAADVKQFVRGQIHRLPNCVRRDDKLQGDVETKIVEAVDGMFLLARLHVDSLRDKRTKADIQTALKMLPKGSNELNLAYDGAIERIEAQMPNDSNLAKAVLSWITYAERPLTTEELCHALAVHPDETDLNWDRILDIEDIVSVCAGLVIVDEESDIIRLVHYTTQEYFVLIRENWNPTAQQEITTTCLTYLSFDPFRSGSCFDRKQFKNRLENYMFLDYASLYWGQHAQTVQEQVLEPAIHFLQDSNLASCAAQIMLLSSTYESLFYNYNFPPSAAGVHLTARFGLHYLLERLLLKLNGIVGILADSKDSEGRTPLSWAAEEGYEAVVKLLVEREDVEADSKDYDGCTPLSWAARRGHAAIVKLLIEREDVEANSKDNDDSTPLSWASSRGHEAIVKLLVEREDVKADFKDSEDRTPLSWAAGEGHEAIVKLLVEREDVEANVRDMLDWTPLSWAAIEGHAAIVKLLVEREDVEANLKDNDGRTPLSWAAASGHIEIVTLLVDREDVEADLKDNEDRMPLSWAAGRGHTAIVKLLVKREDVKANLKDNRGRTPLSWAAGEQQLPWAAGTGEGRAAIVKLLVEREDVEANLKDNEGRTPLSWAAGRGHTAIVKLLVKREDVKADSKNDDGQTPLSIAEEKGHKAVVELLR